MRTTPDYRALLLLALAFILILLGLVQRCRCNLGLRKAAQLFLVIVADEVIIGLGVNHQLDRRFIGQVLQLGERRGDLVEEFFVIHGGLSIGWAKNRIANAKVGYSDLL